MNKPGQVKQTVQDLAQKAAKGALNQSNEVLTDVEEQIGLRIAPTHQDSQSAEPQAAPDPNLDKAKQVDNRRTRDRMQALQTELAQISSKIQSEQNRLREVRDPQAQREALENPLMVPTSRKGREMKGMPGANRAQKRQLAELQSPERRSTPSQ